MIIGEWRGGERQGEARGCDILCVCVCVCARACVRGWREGVFVCTRAGVKMRGRDRTRYLMLS